MERLESAVLRLRAPRRAVPLLPGPRHDGGRDRRLRRGPGAAGADRQDGGGVVAVRASTPPALIGRIRQIGPILPLDNPAGLWHNTRPFPRASSPGRPRRAPNRG